MIEFVVLIMLILFIVWLLIPIFSSGLVFLINIVIMAIGLSRGVNDINKRDMFGFYLLAALATVILFIAEDTRYLSFIFEFMSKALILRISQAVLMIIFFANLFSLMYENYVYLAKKTKEKIKNLKKK